MTSYVTHLESAIDGTHLPAGTVQTLHNGRPLWVKYDLDAVKANMTKEMVKQRPSTIWRYRERLPPEHDSSIVTDINKYECALAGAHVFLVDGLITDCGAFIKAGKETMDWFDVSTLKEPSHPAEFPQHCHIYSHKKLQIP